MVQHHDTIPTLANLFSDLTNVTDSAGNLSGATGFNSLNSFGPYMENVPVNPLTNSSTVVAAGSPTLPTNGWFYDASSGVFQGANTLGAPSDSGN